MKHSKEWWRLGQAAWHGPASDLGDCHLTGEGEFRYSVARSSDFLREDRRLGFYAKISQILNVATTIIVWPTKTWLQAEYGPRATDIKQ